MHLKNKITAVTLLLGLTAGAIVATTANATVSTTANVSNNNVYKIQNTIAANATQTSTPSIEEMEKLIETLKVQIQQMIALIQARIKTQTANNVKLGISAECAKANEEIDITDKNGVKFCCRGLIPQPTCIGSSCDKKTFKCVEHETAVSACAKEGEEIDVTDLSDAKLCCQGLYLQATHNLDGASLSRNKWKCAKLPVKTDTGITVACAKEGETIDTSNTKKCCAGLIPYTSCKQENDCTADSWVCKKPASPTTDCAAEGQKLFSNGTKGCCVDLVPVSECEGEQNCITNSWTCQKRTIAQKMVCANNGETFQPGTKNCCNGTIFAIATDGCTGTETTETNRAACLAKTLYTCKQPTVTGITDHSLDGTTGTTTGSGYAIGSIPANNTGGTVGTATGTTGAYRIGTSGTSTNYQYPVGTTSGTSGGTSYGYTVNGTSGTSIQQQIQSIKQQINNISAGVNSLGTTQTGTTATVGTTWTTGSYTVGSTGGTNVNSESSTSYNYNSPAGTGGSYGGWVSAF